MNKKKVSAAISLALASTFCAIPAFGAETGLYIGSEQSEVSYYSTDYLGDLDVAGRAAIYGDIQENPEDSYVVINEKYQLFNNYAGLASLLDGADDILPDVVSDVATGKLINPLTGEEVADDTEAPVITVTGVVNGDLTNVAVTPVVTTDDVEAIVDITLNDEAFVSGTEIATEGEYTLVVTATDAAGNSDTKTINFTIDMTAPDLAVNTTDETPVAVPAVVQLTGTDLTYSFAVATEEGATLVVNDGDADLTAVEGVYTVDAGKTVTVTATDAVGNASAATSFEVVAPEAVVTTVEVAAVSVEENKTATAVVTVKDQFENEMADQTVTYTVDNAVVTIADGVITAGAYAAAANTATLTATVGEVSGTATVTVTADTTLPTATLEVVDAKHIRVSFSEKMANAGTIANNYYLEKVSNAGNDLLNGAGATAVVAEDAMSVLLRLEDGVALVPAQYILKFNVLNTGTIADLAGNKIYNDTELTFTPDANVLADVTAPTLQSANYSSATRQLVLTFDENVDATSYDATKVVFAGTTLTDSDIVAVAANVATITLSAATTSALDITGTVEVVLTGAIADAADNAVTATKAVSLVTPPELADATATGSSFDETTRILTVKFNEAVTLVDVTKISLDDNGDVAQALTASDVVVAGTDGTDIIKIQLSTTSYNNIKDNVGTTAGLTIAAGAVKDVNDTLNTAIAKVEISYAQDTTAPEITAITYNNQTNVLIITTNELLASLNPGQWSIDTDPTTGAIDLAAATGGVGGVAPTITDNIITATLDATDSVTVEGWFAAGKTIKIYTTAATAVKDLAGNDIGTIALADGSEVALVDQIAPGVSGSVNTLSATKFSVAFDEVMDTTTANDAVNYVVYDNQNDKNIAATAAQLQSDGVTVYLTLGEALTVPNVNNYSLIINNVKDANLNRISNNTTTIFTLGAVDSTAPVVSTVTFTANADKDNDTVAIAFTEAGTGLDKASAENLANYTVKDASGTVVSLAGANAVLTGTTVTITLENGYNVQTGANYTVDVENVKDKADNVMDAYTGTATAAVGDNTAPTITSVEGITGTSSDQVVVTFSEAVEESLAEAIANYTVKTGAAFATTLNDIDAASVVYTETDANDDGTLETFKATITYAAGTLTSKARITTEAGIKDLAGNAMVAGNDVDDSAVTDGVAPTITSVTATTVADKDNDTIEIVFNEAVVPTSAVVAGNPINITLTDSSGNAIDISNATAAMGTSSVANDKVTITLDNSIAQLTTGETYTVSVDGVMDAAGNEVTATASDEAEGDTTAPTFTVQNGNNIGGIADLVLTLSEDVDAATITKADFTVESATDGAFDNSGDESSYIISSVVYNSGTGTVTINLTTNMEAADGTAKVKVTLGDNAAGITDLAGNVKDSHSAELVID